MNWKFVSGKAAANFRRYDKRKEVHRRNNRIVNVNIAYGFTKAELQESLAPLPAPPGSGEVAGNDPHQAAVAMVENARPVRDNGKD